MRSSVDWDPISLLDGLTSDDQVAGIEAAIWCETVASFEGLQFALQPRLAGVAERAWAQRGDFDWTGYADRLAAQAPAWSAEQWEFFRAVSVPWR